MQKSSTGFKAGLSNQAGNPNNKNVLPSQPSQATEPANPPQAMPPIIPSTRARLKMSGSRDIAVKAYCQWQESNVVDENLEANFRKACDVAIASGYDFEQVDAEQDPGLFVSFLTKNDVIVGIAQRFVRDIRDWVED